MNKIKLKFNEPIIILKNNKTTMNITVILKCGKNHFSCYKGFSKTITLHKPDIYDLNKAKNILQASLEQKAYIWAKKYIDKNIKGLENQLKTLKDFSEKANHIIEHDTTYIKKLMK